MAFFIAVRNKASRFAPSIVQGVFSQRHSEHFRHTSQYGRGANSAFEPASARPDLDWRRKASDIRRNN
jgi:hypothetical protein